MFNGLNWLHKTLNLCNPCDSHMVRTVKEAAKRVLSKPVVKKEPMSPYNLKRLVTKLKHNTDLLKMRTLTLALVSYAGFLRYDEASRIRRSDIVFERGYMKIFIEWSKVDKYRKGAWVYVARTCKQTCPYYTLREYLYIANIPDDSSEFIFRGCTRRTSGLTLKGKTPLSYTRARETILEAIASIGLNRKRFGLHSFRRGGATHSARLGVTDRLFKKHGRWRSENAKDGYISEDLNAILSVTKHLGI